MTNLIHRPENPEDPPESIVDTKGQTRPDVEPRQEKEKQKETTLRMVPSMFAMLDDLVKSGGFPSRSACIVALIRRECEEPMDAHAEQIGLLNAWMFKLCNPDNPRRLTKAERTELVLEFRRIANIIDADRED